MKTPETLKRQFLSAHERDLKRQAIDVRRVLAAGQSVTAVVEWKTAEEDICALCDSDEAREEYIRQLEQDNEALRQTLGQPTLNAQTLWQNAQLMKENRTLRGAIEGCSGSCHSVLSSLHS